jgi:6-phosphogluconolactonase
MNPDVRIVGDSAALALAAAGLFAEAAQGAIRKKGDFYTAVSGGTTPQEAFAALASPPFSQGIDWPRVHVFWADERCVPPDHPESNFGALKLCLLGRVSLPDGNVHRIHGELDPWAAADAYESELRSFLGPVFQKSGTLFDLILLGLGQDGHTASLFPETRAVQEKQRWAVANRVEAQQAWRVTLTFPAINASKRAVFLVNGKAKSEVLKRVILESGASAGLPAGLVKPLRGAPEWLVDRDAACLLGQEVGPVE